VVFFEDEPSDDGARSRHRLVARAIGLGLALDLALDLSISL